MTTGDGNVKILLVVFDGVKQVANPIQIIDGHHVFVAYNDTHWNNGILHVEFLRALFDTLPACCENPLCKAYCLILDRFTGHFGPKVEALNDQYHIQTVVCLDTKRGQPNVTHLVFCFCHCNIVIYDLG